MTLPRDVSDAGIRPLVSTFLRYGVLISAFVIMVGLILLIIQVGPIPFVSMPEIRSPEAGTDLTSLRAILRELVPPEPQAVIDTGVLLLVATPMLTVGASVFAFAMEADWLYMVISGIVFTILLLSFTLGRTVSAG